MGIELEYKLAAPSPAALDALWADPAVEAARLEEVRRIEMATVYYDTADRRLGALRWTLRLRRENGALVATLKTPGQGHLRGEWECPAATIAEAIPRLMEVGAPEELPELLEEEPLEAVCAAQFLRRAARLQLAADTVAELCCDVGTLAGGGRELAFQEAEVELKTGRAAEAEAFADALAARHGLKSEPLSKFARAMALAEGRL